MSTVVSKQVNYIKVPQGLPNPATDFEVIETQIDLENLPLGENQILVKTLYFSVDPYLRGRMRVAEKSSYSAALQVGKPVDSGAVAEVIRSTSDKIKKGDIVLGLLDWAQHTVVNADQVVVIPNGRDSKVPLSYYLGVLGMPGLTAYVGLHKICEPIKEGETIYVSSAAGAVGQVVGQYAKALGLRVVGSAGTDEKVKYLLDELNFDAAFNYKNYDDFDAILKETCPNGIDIYFENVGGKMLEAVINNANINARIPVCGMISQYNKSGKHDPIHNLIQVISKRIHLQGFLVSDDRVKYGLAFKEKFTELLVQGKLKYNEDITEGIENLPQAFIGMLQGENFGKACVKVADL